MVKYSKLILVEFPTFTSLRDYKEGFWYETFDEVYRFEVISAMKMMAINPKCSLRNTTI